MNCREGDLAEIVVSECGNEGRRVAVERRNWCGCCWVIQPLQPLRTAAFFGALVVPGPVAMDKTAYPDAWLRPIRDPDPEVDVSEGRGLDLAPAGVAC